MTQKSSMLVIIAALAAVGGLVAPTGQSQRLRIEPRRHSTYPAAYLVYTFDVRDFLSSGTTRGPSRMYYLVPVDPSERMTALLLSHDQLFDHYRIRPAQLGDVPTRMPRNLFSKHDPRPAPFSQRGPGTATGVEKGQNESQPSISGAVRGVSALNLITRPAAEAAGVDARQPLLIG